MPFRDAFPIVTSADIERLTSFYTDDVDAEVERLCANGGIVLDEPADREWGERMATVADPDGNLLHIGSPPPQVNA